MLGVSRDMLCESMGMSRIGQKFGKLSKRCFLNPLGPQKHESVNEKFPKFGLHTEKWQKWRKVGLAEDVFVQK